MLFLLNATALFWSSNKEEAGPRWDGPYKCGPWDR